VTGHSYRLESLKLDSIYPLALFPAWDGDVAAPADITISIGSVPAQLEGATVRMRNFQARGGEALLLNSPRVLRALITSSLVVVEPAPQAEIANIAGVLLGQIQTVLWYLRGFLPLHGSAVMIGDRTVAVIGASGAGKSTLAGSLGGQVIADDTCVIDLTKDRTMVLPTTGQLRLWPDSAQALGYAPDSLPRAPGFKDKVLLGDREMLPLVPAPLSLIVVLEGGELASAPIPLNFAQAATATMGHLQRLRLGASLRSQHDLLTQTARLCSRVPVIRTGRRAQRGGELPSMITEALRTLCP